MSSCSTAFTEMEPLTEYSNVAVYRLNRKLYPSATDLREALPPMVPFPALSEENLMGILQQFTYKKESFWGLQKRSVFYRKELERLVPVIHRNLGRLKERDQMVILSRFDPDKSVLSRHERVSAVIWADEAGLNILFGEIREEITANDPLEHHDWKRILPIPMREAYPDLALDVKKDSPYHLKTILGNLHRTWAVLPITEELQDIKPPSGEKKPDADGPASKDRSLSEKLKELEKAKEDGLISQEEYEKLRKEALEEF